MAVKIYMQRDLYYWMLLRSHHLMQNWFHMQKCGPRKKIADEEVRTRS